MNNSRLHLEIPAIDSSYNILVVFDASAYGYYYDLLMSALRNRKFSILAWDSYETYLLSCPSININLTKDDIKCNYNMGEKLNF